MAFKNKLKAFVNEIGPDQLLQISKKLKFSTYLGWNWFETYVRLGQNFGVEQFGALKEGVTWADDY